MRALVVICLVAACGGESGLMLDVAPPSSDVTTVEVFLPKDVAGMRMGMPPAATQKTSGTVYAVVDTVTADVTGGHARILLQPGSITAVPALLVLGYNGNHEAVSYAVVTDPAGPIQLPHSQSHTIKVDLEAITEVPVAGATTGSAAGGPRLARWSKTALDDTSGACIAVLHDNGRGGFDGDFFSPGDDLDCDGAMPECDDTWYLKVGTTAPDNPRCARDDKTPDTMNACRVGTTVACTDNVGDCQLQAPNQTVPPICAPTTVCDQCNDVIDPSCLQSAITSDATLHVECDLPVGMSGTPDITLCTNTNTTPIPLDLGPQLGASAGLVAAEFDIPPAVMGGTAGLPLAGSATANLHVTLATTGGRGLFFTPENGATPAIDAALPDTHALLVIGVHSGTTRALVLPFVAHYVDDCTQTPSCTLVLGIDNGQPFNDPIWHCAGN